MLAGLVQGISGFAFGLVAMAIWTWAVAPQLAGPMVVFGSLVGQLLSLHSVRRGFDWRRITPFIAGGVCGVPLGVQLLRFVDPRDFRIGLGTLLVVYCTLMLLISRVPPVRWGGHFADGLVGFVSGLMGGLGGFTGPATTLWCTLRRWNKDAQRAVFQSFNIAIHTLTLTLYALTGAITVTALQMFALILPAVIVPTLIGSRIYLRLGEEAFRRVVLGLLMLSGIVMLVSSVRG